MLSDHPSSSTDIPSIHPSAHLSITGSQSGMEGCLVALRSAPATGALGSFLCLLSPPYHMTAWLQPRRRYIHVLACYCCRHEWAPGTAISARSDASRR